MDTHTSDISTDVGTGPDRTDRRTGYLRTGRSPGVATGAGLILLAGLYLLLSPWVVQSMGQIGIAASNVITGLVLALLGFGYARSFDRTHALAWVSPIIGAWVIASPWVIYRGAGPVHTDVEGAPALSAATWTGNIVAGAVALAAGVVLTALAIRTGTRLSRSAAPDR